PQTLKTSEEKPKKRTPNMFILFRKEMMRYKPYNMQMTKYSKIVSEKWKKLSEVEKNELQRRYQINRDQKLQNPVNEYGINDNGAINYPLPSVKCRNENDAAKRDQNTINAEQIIK
ncbi:973_t:CDS:1, partial [Funneliformis mosseae]